MIMTISYPKVTIMDECLDLDQIYESGQVFRWVKLDAKSYIIISGSKIIKADYDKLTNITVLDGVRNPEDYEYWYNYFDLSTDYLSLYNNTLSECKKDLNSPYNSALYRSLKLGKGIRILNQDLVEMVITFIISQQNNIPRIRNAVNHLSELLGDLVEFKSHKYYLFPTLNKLFAHKDLLSKIRVGYRSKYILDAIDHLLNKEYMNSLLSYDSQDTSPILSKLMEIKGVGYKVSRCIALFSLGSKNLFPRDVWINRFIDKYCNSNYDPENSTEFLTESNGFIINASGIIQQYIYNYSRLTKLED